jgi:hypothetical protein
LLILQPTHHHSSSSSYLKLEYSDHKLNMDATSYSNLTTALEADNNWAASAVLFDVYTSLDDTSTVELDITSTLRSSDEGVQNMRYDDIVWKAYWLSPQFADEQEETKKLWRAVVYNACKKAGFAIKFSKRRPLMGGAVTEYTILCIRGELARKV